MGSVYLQIEVDGRVDITFVADLTDVPADLVTAVTRLVDGAPSSECSAFLEPGRKVWTFTSVGSSFALRVESFDMDGRLRDEEVRLLGEIPLLPFAESVLSATREMVSGGLGVPYEDGWPEWPPPTEQLDGLERAIERGRPQP